MKEELEIREYKMYGYINGIKTIIIIQSQEKITKEKGEIMNNGVNDIIKKSSVAYSSNII